MASVDIRAATAEDCGLLAALLSEAFARHQGVGRALMAELARIALARDWTRMVWTVDRNNRPALRFYQSLPGASEAGKHLYMQSGRALRRLAEQG